MKNLYDVIRKPCLTEKGMTLQETNNQVVLKVNPDANKIEISIDYEEPREVVQMYYNDH